MLALFLVAFQVSTPTPTPTPAPAPAGVTVIPTQIQAPTQPTGKSSASVVTAPRWGSSRQPLARHGLMVRVSDVMRVRGEEVNTLSGLGLITGLAGTGDTGVLAKEALANLLKNVNTQVTPAQLQSKNLAMVWVEASMPSGLKPGTRIDAKVSTIGDASSLVGGNLVSTELIGMDGQVYATVSGSVSVGGFSFQAEGASAVSNHPTVGMVARGCKIERGVPSAVETEHGFIYLDSQFRKGSFANAGKVTDAINALYPNTARALDGTTVRVRVPNDIPEEDNVRFLATVLSREIEAEAFARIVVNERTGVIVIGEGVRIGSGAVTKGDLTVTIAETPEASQPGPLSGGQTESVPRTSLNVEEENMGLRLIAGAANLNEVVEVLDVLGVSSRDMIQLLQAMSQSGMLNAEIIQL
jgi:flagellar P-ring protein precursor FlgI